MLKIQNGWGNLIKTSLSFLDAVLIEYMVPKVKMANSPKRNEIRTL